MVVGMDVVGKIRIKEYVLKIFQKGIPHLTTRSGIIMKHSNKKREKGLLNKPSKAHEELCYRCGMDGH